MTAAAPRRSRLSAAAPVALLLAVAAAAWVISVERMAGMDAGPGGELGDLGWFAVTWLVMMAAMMLPAITPMVAAYASGLPNFSASDPQHQEIESTLNPIKRSLFGDACFGD